MSRVTLVLGGARSGKSRYAESLARGRKTYIATAEALDEEMGARIAEHRKRRGGGWHTIEAPIDLAAALGEAKADFILADCITLWLSNLMHRGLDPMTEAEKLCRVLGRIEAHVVLVANEVGLGIVPDNRLARQFRDAQGFVNQRLAEAADEVIFIAAGLPLKLKTRSRVPSSRPAKSKGRGRKG